MDNSSDKLVREAIAFSIKCHESQIREGSGLPYIVHPISVYSIVKKYKESKNIKELLIAALLHDTVEDCNVSLEEIEQKFGKMVASLVAELTNDIKEILRVGKKEYMLKKVMALSSYALVIKLADFIENMTDEPLPKAVERTAYILSHLKNKQLTATQQRMFNDLCEIMKEFHGKEI